MASMTYPQREAIIVYHNENSSVDDPISLCRTFPRQSCVYKYCWGIDREGYV